MFATYSWPKTALNAITVAFASDLESDGIKVNAACPGFTSTDLDTFPGTRTVQQAARELVRLALLDANGPTGTFSEENGVIPMVMRAPQQWGEKGRERLVRASARQSNLNIGLRNRLNRDCRPARTCVFLGANALAGPWS
jgi:NAD(P)-dependent dehydrogenase (short-subunit alcohol dehydrogenase family)